MKNKTENTYSTKRLLVGILILLAGAFILAKNFGFIPGNISHFIFNWRMLIIAIGLINLAVHSDKTPGVILIFIGGALYLPYYFDINLWHIFWPSILIIVGVMLIVRRGAFGPCQRKDIIGGESDYLDEVNIFGGGDKIIISPSFKGGRVTCIFGGSNINLATSHLAKGKQYIEMFAVFGGSKFIFPEDWKVKVEMISIFGGFKDARLTQNTNPSAESELIIKGFVLFGGGEIRSF